MATTVAKDGKQEIAELWVRFKADQSDRQMRNRLVENYLPLVKYNGERIWARLPDGVELDVVVVCNACSDNQNQKNNEKFLHSII